jgi:transcriptional regulator with XRE-family HTH domain
VSEELVAAAESVAHLGARLRVHRQRLGLSVREVAGRIGVSPSFISQLETGKSQPSVARLYALTQLLDISIDDLFSVGHPVDAPSKSTVEGFPLEAPTDEDIPPGVPTGIPRSQLGSPTDAWPSSDASIPRLSVTRPGERLRLEMDTGVVWEQLATNTGSDLEFMEIIYPPHSASTSDNRLMQHEGWEFGYLTHGELEITVGFEVFTLHAGEAVGFQSTTPHLFSNLTNAPARGIWLQRHSSGNQ